VKHATSIGRLSRAAAPASMRFWRAASSYLSYQAVHPLIIPALAIRLMARCAMV